MWSTEDVFEYAMSTISGKDFDICVIDFITLYSNVAYEINRKNRDFRDELIKRFGMHAHHYPMIQHRRCKWTIEILCSNIINDVVDFNKNFKSRPEKHTLLFVCLDNDLLPYQEALLQRSYIDSEFFQLDYEKIFNYLRGKKSKNVVQDKLINFCPLLLDVNSYSSGLIFNYYYTYLNQQISSTNNIFLTFTFTKDINRESFPSEISVILNTTIENMFLKNSPSTILSDDGISIQSNLLIFKHDSTRYQPFDGMQTSVTFSLIGVTDFGFVVEKVSIWQDKFDLSVLNRIQLKDDIREWNEDYQPCVSNTNSENEITFEKRDDPTKKCHCFPVSDQPVRNDGHSGISTMKKTTKDCYDLYISDPTNSVTKDGRKISKILTVPVYYVIIPSSCECGPPDTNKSSKCGEITFKGTITDPNVPNRIQLAYTHREVLRSRSMIQHNRYFRRTFYYVDEINENNEIIRYLFCAEYPYILSVLDKLEKSGEISKSQKYDGYLRFSNMLHRLIQADNLSQSIKLIQFNDQSENIDYADFKPLWHQIKENIDQWYNLVSDNDTSFLSIETKILSFKQIHHVVLFFTDQAREDPLIMTLIRNLQEQLQINGYIVEDAETNLDFIDTEKQIIFICTGNRNDQINRLIINSTQYKINKCGVLRDVFILINDAIQHFPCRFIRSVPYLTFDLRLRSADLNFDEIQQIIYYLNNMNILFQTDTDTFEDINYFLDKSSLQNTSVGAGCAAAFYFNYYQLLSPSSDHRHRLKSIDGQLQKENLIDLYNNKSVFIPKWVFVIPWTIKDTDRLLSCASSLNQSEQEEIGLELSVWKSADPKFVNCNLFITVGGVFQRSYSALIVYKLTNLKEGKTYYFPMEIPAALHRLQNQYENILSHFNFGSFDPVQQALVFRENVEKFLSNDQDKTSHENLILVPLDNPCTSNEMDSITNFQQAQSLLQTLWQKLCSSI